MPHVFSSIFRLVLITSGLKSVFGPSITFDINGIIDMSFVVALILYAVVSEKYTPPLVVGLRTGMEDFTMLTFSSGYFRSSKKRLYFTSCVAINFDKISSSISIKDLIYVNIVITLLFLIPQRWNFSRNPRVLNQYNLYFLTSYQS